MPFHMPSMSELLKAANQLDVTYESERKLKDKNRWFNSIRPATHNQDRLQDIQFIKALAAHIAGNKFSYGKVDPVFKAKDYAKDIAPFLKEALSGALLLDLRKITQSYGNNEEAVKKNSALGNVILNVFQVDGLDEFPLDKQKNCLKALKHYMTAFDLQAKANKEPSIQWHPLKKNRDLMERIEQEVKEMSSESSPALS